jgi:hypothetical protein
MDLISAIDEAKAKSLKNKAKVYIILGEDGECSLSNAPLAGVTHAFSKGQEVPLPDVTKIKKAKVEQEENVSASAEETPKKQKVNSKSKTNKKMATSKKAKPAKKAAKKSATKDRPAVKGKAVAMKIKDVIKAIKAGKNVYSRAGFKLNLAKTEARPDHDKEREVIIAE